MDTPCRKRLKTLHKGKINMSNKPVYRRQFLKSALVTGAGLTILPSGVLSGKNAPSNKLNIALIGAYGRARAHYKGLANENVVAICDINEEHLAIAAKKFPNAKHYVDWRKCLEQKDIDAVVCCTLDHTHAFVANWSMERGYHIYCEKPLGITVEEVRLCRETYLKNKNKIATQHGTQRHQKPNFNRVRELIKDGAIGELKDVHAWGNRQLYKPGYPKGVGEPPKTLHYDLWLGPAQHHPYNPEYFSGRPGMNCLNWNMYWDFGTGQVGDMGSHTMDLAWNAIDAKLPLSASATGDEFNPEVTPVELTAIFEHPANDWRPAINVLWHQGGAMPKSPMPYIDLDKISHGALFKGDKGFLISSFDNLVLVPYGKEADLTYYQPRSKENVIPDMGDFQQEWFDACKGDLKTSCDFEYGANLMEQMLLGLVAYQVGEKIEYDGAKGAVKNNPKANDLLSRTYRKGWTLKG
jgi:predicted dehydrogenase